MQATRCAIPAALVCALLAPLYAQTSTTDNADADIGALVQTALERNREIQAARVRMTEAQALVRQAGMRPNPTLEMQGGTGRPLATKGEEEFSTGYSQALELGGKRDKRVKVAETSVELARAEVDERGRLLGFDVRSRAIEALSKKEKARVLEKLAQLNEQALRLTQARAQEGDIPRLDVQLLQVEQTRNEAQRTAIEGQLDADLSDLRRLLTLDASAAVTLGNTLPPNAREMALQELRELALRERPDLRIARLLQTQGNAEVTLAQAQARPDVTLSLRYSHKNSAFDQLGLSSTGTPIPIRDRDDVVLFGASLPLFTGRRNQGNIDAAAARASATSLRVEHLASTIPLEVETAYKRWRAAKNTLAVFGRGVVEQSERNLEVIRQAYQLGQLRLLDVLNEQRRLTETELAYIDAKTDLARAVVELERAAGAPLP
ncbi:MAG: TolC family protein [Bryobacteraceae bacterium]